MVQKKRKLTDDFREYNLIRKKYGFAHPLKRAKLEKAEGTRILQKYAEKRMSFLLNSLYPEMSAERKQQLINKFRENTGLLNQVYHVLEGGTRVAYYDSTLGQVKIIKKNLDDRAELMNSLDHEAIHFLTYESNRKLPARIEEIIAEGVSSSIVPDETARQEIKRIKDFPRSDISFPLKNKRLSKEISTAKNFKEVPALSLAKSPLPSAIPAMAHLLSKEVSLKTRNQFLRDTIDGKNPVISFNNLMKQKGIRAVIEGKRLKIKKIEH